MELGVMVNIYEDTDIRAAFEVARLAGFTRGQVTSHIHGITADEVRLMGLAARQTGFHVDAVGCYINPLRLEETTLYGVDGTDWKTLVENMGMMNGVERIVCWSGTLGKTLDAPNLLNQEEETFNSLFIALSGLLEQVRGLPVQIVLEPFTTHVLCDGQLTRRMARKFSFGKVSAALDVASLISAKSYAARNTRTQDLVTELGPVVGLVHLRDIRLDDQRTLIYERPGAGTLDYGAYLNAIVRHLPEVPIIVEQVLDVHEMRAARTYIEGILKDYSLHH